MVSQGDFHTRNNSYFIGEVTADKEYTWKVAAYHSHHFCPIFSELPVFTATNVSSVSEINGLVNFSVFPNPIGSESMLQIQMNTERVLDLRLEIFDLVGRKVYKEEVSALFGKQTYEVDPKNMGAGSILSRLKVKKAAPLRKSLLRNRQLLSSLNYLPLRRFLKKQCPIGLQSCLLTTADRLLKYMTFKEEINKRKTFGIISHPDAGKTTLTEKLLLFGGAIQVAGAVKSNKIKKTATSDFMEIEKQRGISVATSVMGFKYKGLKINILDTPGHKDFAEDTYRTLTAVDSVIVVIDVAKGVEEQTEKLVEVCKMRKTPIIVFINKLDREGKDSFDLLDELEEKLGLTVRPMSWPIGMGQRFQGVYNMFEKKLVLFRPHSKQSGEELVEITDLESEELEKHIGETAAKELREEVTMVDEMYMEFDEEYYDEGELSPVFFGSAINNFGVKEMLDCFVEIAPTPLPRPTEERMVDPYEDKFSGFVFKIHANMDPRHRDRIAFVRICSGKFQRNTNYLHVRQNRQMKFANPTTFMASKKNVVEVAYPGDVVGLYDSGNFKIGDSITEGEVLHFKGIPSFSPEQFRFVNNADPMKQKQLQKGLEQLMDEGVAQLFTKENNNRKIIGTVGALQFEVIQYRLKHEYGASCTYEPTRLHKACWVTCDDDAALKEFMTRRRNDIARDKHGNLVFLAESAWMLKMAQENHEEVQFHFTSEF